MSSEQLSVNRALQGASSASSRFQSALLGAAMSPWQALRREIFPIAWVLMDVALLTPFALSFMRWAQFWSPGQVAFLLFLLMLLPYNLIRFMSLLKVSIDRQRWILGGIFVLVLFITLRSLLYGFSSLLDFRWITQIYRHFSETSSNLWLRDVGLFVLVLFAWGRGLALVDREPDILKVGLKMRLGALFLTPLAIWLVETRLIWDMAPFVLLYFLATLTAVSLIRAEQIEQEKTGLSASLSAGWLSSIFVANLLVVLTGGFFAFLVSGNTPAVLILWFAPALQALVQLGTVAFAAFSYLGLPLFVRLFNALQAIVFFLRRLLQPLLASWTGNAQDNAGGFGATEVLTFNDFVILTNSLNPVVKLGLLLIPIGLVVLVSLFVNRYSQRRAAERDRAGTGEKMAVFDEDDLSVGQRLLNRLGLLRNWQTAVSIRRIYAQMCRAAAGAGMPRAKTETPYEYLRSLAQVWPSNQADAELVTQAYIRVRYGEVPEDKDELAAIHAAWNRLKHTPPMTSSDASVTMPQLQKNEE